MTKGLGATKRKTSGLQKGWQRKNWADYPATASPVRPSGTVLLAVPPVARLPYASISLNRPHGHPQGRLPRSRCGMAQPLRRQTCRPRQRCPARTAYPSGQGSGKVPADAEVSWNSAGTCRARRNIGYSERSSMGSTVAGVPWPELPALAAASEGWDCRRSALEAGCP